MREIPTLIVVGTVEPGSNGADDFDVWMFRVHGLVDHLEALFENGRNVILIADTEILQTKWLRVTRFRPLAPHFEVASAALDRLWQQEPRQLLAWFDATQPATPTAVAIVKRERHYFSTHAPRIHYRTFRGTVICRLVQEPWNPAPSTWFSTA